MYQPVCIHGSVCNPSQVLKNLLLWNSRQPLSQKTIKTVINIRCSNCKITYYGKTYCHVFTRTAEHMGISILTGKCLKGVKQSAVSDHLLECNCSIDFDHFDILASGTNKFRLLIKERLLIKRDQPQLNKTIKSFPLKRFDWDHRW